MAFDYATFKSYLATFLWKQDDADLVTNLDSLIRMANAELNTRLDVQRRQVTVTILPETQDYLLPADYRTMGLLSNNSIGNYLTTSDPKMRSTTLNDIYALRARGTEITQPFYAVDKNNGVDVLRLVGPFSTQNPGDFTLVYRTSVPDYQTTDASWVEDLYLDLYVYTVLSHTAPFLREDERIPVWAGMKAEALNYALEEDAHHMDHGGTPLQMQPHRQVPNTRDRW